MRISVYEGEPGYDTFVQALRDEKTIRVYLDDQEVGDVFEADDETGIVKFAARDAKGDLILTDDNFTMSRARRGRVRIVIA